MPDRDVFDRTVGRGWQTASRRLIGSSDDPDALPSVLRALGTHVKQDGCPGFDAVVDCIADAIGARDPRQGRVKAHQRLERGRLENGNRATQNAADAAKRLIVTASVWVPNNVVTLAIGELRSVIAMHLLAELADGWMCPSGLLAEIIENEQVSFQTIQARRERAKQMIVGSVETRRLAQQLLADPSGCLVTVPRMARVRMSQAEILLTSLA